MPFSVVVKGFKSRKHAVTWINWFEGQGEQDQDFWFEANDLESQVVDVHKPYEFNEEAQQITIHLQ